jgi:ATP-dependent Clp protease ATP-binding subunit ClpA
MGVTKLAAQKRFVPRAEATTLDPEQGFGRFTPRARNAVVAAQNVARETASSEITPDHLLLGVLSDPAALATILLLRQHVDAGALRAAVTQAPAGPHAVAQRRRRQGARRGRPGRHARVTDQRQEPRLTS